MRVRRLGVKVCFIPFVFLYEGSLQRLLICTSTGPLGRLLVRGQPGWEIVPELQPKANEPIIDKPMRSAFAHTDFALLLQVRGIRNLILAGVVTDVCVFGTMKDACDKGLDCLLVRDACAAASPDVHDVVMKSVEMEGGIPSITTCL